MAMSTPQTFLIASTWKEAEKPEPTMPARIVFFMETCPFCVTIKKGED
jgi:hypothetical protein